MKKKNFLLLASFLWCLVMHSQELRKPIQASDQNEIIKQCLTFQPLQQKLGTTKLNDKRGFLIQDHGVQFLDVSNLMVNGEKVILIDKNDLKTKNYPVYFLFHTINITNNEALVRLNVMSDDQKTTTPITIFFSKENNQWRQTNYKFEL